MIVADIEETTYEVTTTKSGKKGVLVIFRCKFEDVRQWLFGAQQQAHWKKRSSKPCPRDPQEFVDRACKGALRPTKRIGYIREDGWPKVVKEEIGQPDPALVKFLNEANELFGPVEVVRVRW